MWKPTEVRCVLSSLEMVSSSRDSSKTTLISSTCSLPQDQSCFEIPTREFTEIDAAHSPQ